MIPSELLAKVVLTPAERQVLIEQVQTMAVAGAEFQKAVESGAVAKIIPAFYELTKAHDYIGGLLSNKVEAALHALMREQTNEG